MTLLSVLPGFVFSSTGHLPFLRGAFSGTLFLFPRNWFAAMVDVGELVTDLSSGRPKGELYASEAQVVPFPEYLDTSRTPFNVAKSVGVVIEGCLVNFGKAQGPCRSVGS